MNKLAVVRFCSECPNASYVRTQDPGKLQVYVGCELSHRSFDYDTLSLDPVPIQPWCELPDAPPPSKPPKKIDFRTVDILEDGHGKVGEIEEVGKH